MPEPMMSVEETVPQVDEATGQVFEEESLIEEVSIDGMCGVY
ncbi:mycofactocin precursor MftA [Actinomadura sp. NPDC047616]